MTTLEKNSSNPPLNMGPVNASIKSVEFSDELFRPVLNKKVGVQELSRPSLSYWHDAWLRLKKNKQALGSLTFIFALVLFTLCGRWVWDVDPSVQDLDERSAIPSWGTKALVVPSTKASWEGVHIPADQLPSYAEGTPLKAPENFELVGEASNQVVRLKWSPVPGATGYHVYRTLTKPASKDELGLPLDESSRPTRLSYEDKLDLEPGTYYYSVVPTRNGEEASEWANLEVKVFRGITYERAQKMDPNAKVGDLLTMARHPLGTDYLGRDLLARLIEGARVSLFIGFFAPLIYEIIGVLVGGIAGYAGGALDAWLMRFSDLVVGLPFLLFMILFKIAFGIGPGESGIFPMLISLVVLSWPSPARLVRGQVLQLRNSEFVQASVLLGANPLYIILRHLVPNTFGVLLVSLTFAIPAAIFTEAFLSFIGMGVAPPTPSWGSMCNDGIQTILRHPHEFLFPAIFISLTVLSFNLLGDGLRDALDPKLRSIG